MKYLLIALLLISTQAQAATWILIHYEFHQDSYFCTYQLQGGSYEMTIQSPYFCDTVLDR